MKEKKNPLKSHEWKMIMMPIMMIMEKQREAERNREEKKKNLERE